MRLRWLALLMVSLCGCYRHHLPREAAPIAIDAGPLPEACVPGSIDVVVPIAGCTSLDVAGIGTHHCLDSASATNRQFDAHAFRLWNPDGADYGLYARPIQDASLCSDAEGLCPFRFFTPHEPPGCACFPRHRPTVLADGYGATRMTWELTVVPTDLPEGTFYLESSSPNLVLRLWVCRDDARPP